MEKPMINITTAGHVDHGKSTLLGRLLYELGEVPEELRRKLEKEADSFGKKTFEFAYMFDKSMESRQRGLTLEAAFRGFETKDRRFNIIDAPGHKDFVANMITGAAEADAAILVVDAPITFHDGMKPQTKEHAMLLFTLGVSRLIVALNQMDKADFSKEVYDSVRDQLDGFLKDIGYKSEIHYIPISAYFGDNVTKRSARIPWYTGPTIYDALNGLEEPPRLADKPLRMPVLRTFKTGSGPVIAGKIESGRVKVGDVVAIVPYPGKGIMTGEVKSIEWQHNPLKEAGPGYDVGIMLTRVDKGFVTRQVKKGYVVGDVKDPPLEVERFQAKILIFDHPGSISVGYSPTLHCHQAVVPCTISELEGKFDPKTGEVKEAKPDFLKNGEGATAWIAPHKPLVIEETSKTPRMGRFALRDMGRTIGAGMCIRTISKRR